MDLFADHRLPFAAYADPSGYAALSQLKTVRQNHYEQHVPRTVAAARGIFSAVTRRDEWGQQYVTREKDGTEGGTWRTETIAHQYKTGWMIPTGGSLPIEKPARRGKALAEHTVL